MSTPLDPRFSTRKSGSSTSTIKHRPSVYVWKYKGFGYKFKQPEMRQTNFRSHDKVHLRKTF